jgi:dipeptidyl aminopeptidase/acylaminoacyl peptidase
MRTRPSQSNRVGRVSFSGIRQYCGNIFRYRNVYPIRTKGGLTIMKYRLQVRFIGTIGLIFTVLLWALAGTPFRVSAQTLPRSSCKLNFTQSTSSEHFYRTFDPVSGTITDAPTPAGGVVSPDGQTRVISQPVGGRLQLLLERGNDATALTLNPPDTDGTTPAWSPDGSLLAFTVSENGIRTIYEANADGSVIHNLTNARAQDSDPAWSPDGQQIAFRSNRTGNAGLWLIDSDGTDLKHVTEYAGPPYDWSPDGRYIAAQLPPGHIVVVEVASGKTASMNGRNTRFSNPIWSPDGAWLGYLQGGVIEGPNTTRPLGKQTALFKMRPDGSAQTQISPSDLAVSNAQWSPDNDLIAFVSGGQLYLIDGNGENLRPVDKAQNVTSLMWECPAKNTPVTVFVALRFMMSFS